MSKIKRAKEVSKNVIEWCMKHWIFIIIAAASAYIGTVIYKMLKDDGIGPDGKPYYEDFGSPEQEETNESE